MLNSMKMLANNMAIMVSKQVVKVCNDMLEDLGMLLVVVNMVGARYQDNELVLMCNHPIYPNHTNVNLDKYDYNCFQEEVLGKELG
jgi:hypothetical protein